MANIIRILSGSDDKKPKSFPVVQFGGPKSETEGLRKSDQIFSAQEFDPRTNPHKHRLAIHDPRLVALRARNLPPWERKKVYESLLERLIYQIEKED
jgi:hypothetical protein